MGRRIRALRDERALTQAELARRSGLSQSNIVRIEAAERSPTLGSLAKVAQGLGVSLADLMADATIDVKPAKAEKAWYRLCSTLRDRDERFLRAVERVVRAMESLDS